MTTKSELPQRVESMDLPSRLLREAQFLIATKGRCNESSDVILLREAAEAIAGGYQQGFKDGYEHRYLESLGALA